MPAARPRSFLFYVSGHGYGHARRMTQVMRELLHRAPDASIHIRSAAPPRVFQPMSADRISMCEIDSGLVEINPLKIDRAASLERLVGFMSRAESIVADEVAAAGRLAPHVIVADVPFLAGDVARRLGVPCIGISNFTWDWIYASLFGDTAAYAKIHRRIVESYGLFTALLQLPFGKTCSAIVDTRPTPLIALTSRRSVDEIKSRIGIAPSDRRPRVLIGTRGSLSPATLERAADNCSGCLFLLPTERGGGALPRNALPVGLDYGLDFSDLLAVSDVVVSKLGYGMISECISSQTRLLWPPREGFAEDAVVAEQAPAFVPMLAMNADAYQAGDWKAPIEATLALPPARQTMSTAGGQRCADFLLSF